MKRLPLVFAFLTALALAISACGGEAATGTPPEPPATGLPPTEPPPSPPTDIPIPTQAELKPVVDLAGPPMEVGSKYLYVDGTVLVAVPGGPFIMGYNFADNLEREVTVSDFWIYSTEVTNRQYALCVQLEKCSPPDPKNSPTYGDYRYLNHPVTGVNHTQAGEYCAFVKGRLPTEAEWEKTARGPDGNIFPWGDNAPNCSLLNQVFCKGMTTHVNEYPNGVSYYGAWDMSGNAREWAADWYSPTYNAENPLPDPLGPEFGEKRSVRSSSYQDSPNAAISAHRFSFQPDQNLIDLGFRCVVEDPTVFAPWCEMTAYAGTGPFGSEADCTPQVECNSVSISQSPLCTPNYTPYTIVSVNLGGTPPDGWTYDVPGCSAMPGEQTPVEDKFICYPGAVGPASAEGSCVDAVSCVSTCPAHYNKVGDVCQWDGSGTIGTECLPGSTYDPLLQCCSALPGSGVDFNLCPAGFYPLNGVCVPNPAKVEDQKSQDILFASCSPPVIVTKTPGGGGDEPGDGPGGCVSPTQCSQNQGYDGCNCVDRPPSTAP
jgi:formylglycine-generating enzyme required for sulfatase activity